MKKKANVLTTEGIIIIALLEHNIIFKILGDIAADTNHHEKQIFKR